MTSAARAATPNRARLPPPDSSRLLRPTATVLPSRGAGATVTGGASSIPACGRRVGAPFASEPEVVALGDEVEVGRGVAVVEEAGAAVGVVAAPTNFSGVNFSFVALDLPCAP